MQTKSVWGKRYSAFLEERSTGSGRAEGRKYAAGDSNSMVDAEGLGANEVKKPKKFCIKKEKVEDVRSSQFDDGGEACSGTEGGLVFGSLKKRNDFEALCVKSERFSPHSHKRRSKKLFFGGT